MNALRAVLLGPLVMACLIACDDNPVDDDTGNPPDPTKADQVATIGFQALGDTLAALENRDLDQLRGVRFDAIRDKLEEALTHESNNGIAHLGLAIVEIVELNYSDEIWGVVDSLDAWQDAGGDIDWPPFALTPRDPHRMLIGRQFELMTTLPVVMSMRMATEFPSNVSVAQIQAIISNEIRPALNRAVSHLNVVESETDTELRIHIDDNGVQEDIVVDLGEILVFSAAVHAVRAGFSTALAYDVDFFGPDGGYDWLDDVSDLNGFTWCRDNGVSVTVTDKGGGHVDLHFHGDQRRSDALTDSILVAVLHYNLEDREEFLALRDGGDALEDAHADLLGVLQRLESAAVFIRNRPHETEDNVIKLADLTDLDADVADPDRPNFMQGWTRIEDAIDFVRDVLTGPVTFTEELGPNDTSFTFTVDLSRLFLSPTDDWNDLLPYHRWSLPSGGWLTFTEETYSWDNGGFWHEEYYVRTGPSTCTYMYWDQVDMVTYTNRYWDLDGSVFDYLDAPNGSPIDLDIERVPYFPDYTFDGIFPGMTRT
ncbi:MAG TPA: hypothetical protein VEC56_09590, partial [Candidatus Krumholzibacteria bacterium]|nr:hypothetical protein [Candidatus Krumholzibacteria bacterium]